LKKEVSLQQYHREAAAKRDGAIVDWGALPKISAWVGLSPTRTLIPFWGNFRVDGDSPETPKFIALAPDSSLVDLP
jgi:hypothetical protein